MSMRPKMKRRLLILGGIGVLLAALIAVGVGIGNRRQAVQIAATREQGMRAYAAGDYPTALKYLSNYLERSRIKDHWPGTSGAEAFFAYAKSRASVPMSPPATRVQHLTEARSLYETLLSLQPDYAPAQRELLGLYLRLGYLAEAQRLSDDMLARNPNDIEALKGKIQAMTRQPTPAYADALKVCERLESVAPDDLWGRVQSQVLRLQTGVPEDQLIARAEQLRTAHEKDPRYEILSGETFLALARSTRGDAPMREEWGKQALAHLRAAAELPPVDAAFVRRLIGLLDYLGQFDLSLAVLQRGDDAKLNDAPLRAELVERLWQNGMFKAVIDRTAPAPAAGSGAASHPAAGGFDANTAARRAWSLYIAGDGPAARNEADGIVRALDQRTSDPIASAWATALQARFARQQQEPREMIKQCQQALAKDPENAAVYAMMGDAYVALGEQENAAQGWSAAAQKAPTWGLPNALVARVMLSEGRADEALQRATNAVRRSPGSRVAAEVFVQARFAALGSAPRPADLDEVLKQVAEVQRAWPNDAETLPLYVTLLARTGKKPAAAEALRAAAAASPPLPTETLLRLEGVARAEGISADASDALLNAARGGKDAGPAVAVRKAMELLAAGHADEGLASLREAQHQANGDADLRWRMAVASYLDAAGDPSAVKAWAELGDANPKDLTVQTAILSANSRAKDRELWRRTIDRVKTLTGEEGLLWRTERCRWLLTGTDPAGLSEAVTLLTELVRQRPNQPEGHRLLGLALERDGKLPKAADELTQAANLRPDDLETALDLIRVQRAVGNGKEARARMDQLAQRRNLPAEARGRLASWYERDNAPERAIALLTAGGGASPTTGPATAPVSPATVGRLARLYWRVGNLSEAESLFGMLLDDPAATATDLNLAAEFFGARGRMDRAGAALDRLGKMSLRPPAMELILARFAERFPGTAVAGDAGAHYAAATAAAPKSAEAWRALAAFHLRNGRPAEAADAAEKGVRAAGGDASLTALRDRVALVKSLKRPADAQPLIDLIAREPTNAAAAEMLQVVADAQSAPPSPEAAARSAARLREIADRHPDFLPAQLQIIHYYLITGRTDDAATLATRAAQAFPSDPEPARLLAEAYRRSNQPNKWAKVMEAASQWRERSAADPLAADLALAEAQLAQSQPQAAAQRLAPYVKGPPATQPAAPGSADVTLSDRDAALYRLYGRALIAAGHGSEAAALLRPLLPTVSDARLIWLGLATAQADADAATAWIGQVASHLPKDSTIEQSALAEQWHAVGKRFGTAAAFERARDVLQPLIARADAGADLWNLEGRNALELGDYDGAVKAWRKVVAGTSGPQAPASNNLAYVLLVRGDKGDLEEARKLAESAVAASPEDSNYHDTLARIYARLGQHDKSVAAFRTAIAKDPANVEPMIGLADELTHGGKKAEAAEAKDLLARINRVVTRGPPLSTPTRKQLEGLRAAMDVGDGAR